MYLNAYFRLIKPRYLMYVGSVTAIASFVSHGFTVDSIFAVLSVTFLTAGLFVLDDFADIEADRIIHPDRPLPQELISKRSAFLFAATIIVASIMTVLNLKTYQIGLFCAMMTFGFMIIVLKLGTLPRALLASAMMGFLYPFGATINLQSILFGLMIGLPHIGGSIAKDYLHVKGDSLGGLPLPPSWAKPLATSIFLICSVIVWIPAILHLVNWSYMPPMLVTSLCCWILSLRLLKGDCRKVYVLGGIAMTFTLMAFVLGSF